MDTPFFLQSVAAVGLMVIVIVDIVVMLIVSLFKIGVGIFLGLPICFQSSFLIRVFVITLM